jgi:hypothetical protein
MKNHMVLPLALIAFATTALAQKTPPANERAARAVADSFFKFIEREKWDSAAALVDIARFEPFFRQQIAMARTELPQPDMTVESMMAQDSTMPRAVAEWQVQRFKNFRQPAFGDKSYLFAGVRTQQELFALTPSEALARWIEAQDERTQLRRSFQMQNCPADAAAVLARMPAQRRTILATATQDDSTAFVIHTVEGPGAFQSAELMIGGETVMVLRKKANGWRIDPRANLMRNSITGGFISYGCPQVKKD